MKLHSVHWQGRMHQPHDQAICFRVDAQFARRGRAFDHQRVVTGRFQWTVNAVKDSSAGVFDVKYFAVDRLRTYHLATERLTNGLMTETHAQDRNGLRRLVDEVEADTCFVGRTRTG